jgi:hypothetical protein
MKFFVSPIAPARAPDDGAGHTDLARPDPLGRSLYDCSSFVRFFARAAPRRMAISASL